MHRGNTWGYTLGWAFTLGLLGAGCTTPRRSAPPPVAEAPAPTCPESIAADKPLELDSWPRLRPRSWLSSLDAPQLGFAAESTVQQAFRKELPLTSGTLEVVGLRERPEEGRLDGGATVLLLKPEARGHCVVNHWSTWFSFAPELSLAGSWVSPNRTLAILLLKAEDPPGTEAPETRWAVLATDGHRVWSALGEPPRHLLLVPSVSLLPKGQQLYLDVQQQRVTRLRLGPDGRFTPPGSSR
jgi:hypothetical protein